MSILKSYFDPEVNQCSPVQEDFMRKVQYDADGNEHIVFVPVDYASIQASYGSVNDWSLDALLKAGVNPNFPIHTGMNTRLEGVNALNEFDAVADDIIKAESESTKE